MNPSFNRFCIFRCFCLKNKLFTSATWLESHSMTDNLRPTRAEATDVANAVLDGSDAIILGAETLRGLYHVDAISSVGKICAESEKVFNQDLFFKKTVKHVAEPMSHMESIASSAVRAAIKVKASVIICFTSSGTAARQKGEATMKRKPSENKLWSLLNSIKPSDVVGNHTKLSFLLKEFDVTDENERDANHAIFCNFSTTLVIFL